MFSENRAVDQGAVKVQLRDHGAWNQYGHYAPKLLGRVNQKGDPIATLMVRKINLISDTRPLLGTVSIKVKNNRQKALKIQTKS